MKITRKIKTLFRLPKNQAIQSDWAPFTKLLIKSDGSDWVLSSIVKEMKKVCDSINIDTIDSRNGLQVKKQERNLI